MDSGHPMGNGFGGAFSGSQVTDYPAQTTVDNSGTGDIAPAGYDGGNAQELPETSGNLPRPATRPMATGMDQLTADPLDILDLLHSTAQLLHDSLKMKSLSEDESIKRRMRGPLRDSAEFTDHIAEIVFGPVPSGEIWLVDRYVVSTDQYRIASTNNVICRVFVGATSDPSSMIDITNEGDGNVSDNTQPVIMFPNSSIYFQWDSINAVTNAPTNAYARVNYRSIAENVQFAKGNENVI